MRSRAKPERVLADVREGAVSREAAERDYGVVLEQRDPPSWVVDEAATARRRADMRDKSANARSPSPATAAAMSSKT